jgi:tetraacyldisaccharide 4'-kinase
MQILKWVLLPLTIIYGLVIAIRNLLYNKGVFKRTEFDFPIICIGNLSVGGTGKTPHIEWLIQSLQLEYRLAVLSRGYGRRTTGYLVADEFSKAEDIGDEPAQIIRKYPQIQLAVSENRVFGVPALLGDFPDTSCILMDDGFQHLAIQAGLNIVLTDYSNRFTHDWLLPSGRLREFRNGYKRADILIVTKCPPTLSLAEQIQITKEIQPFSHQQVFFSTISHGECINLDGKVYPLNPQTPVLAISSIANAKPFDTYVSQQFDLVHHFKYADHQRFTEKEVKIWLDWRASLNNPEVRFICTEKDASKIKDVIGHNDLFHVLPVKVEFLNDASILLSRIRQYIQSVPIS